MDELRTVSSAPRELRTEVSSYELRMSSAPRLLLGSVELRTQVSSWQCCPIGSPDSRRTCGAPDKPDKAVSQRLGVDRREESRLGFGRLPIAHARTVAGAPLASTCFDDRIDVSSPRRC